jgi:small subunit ribosomal protein S27e
MKTLRLTKSKFLKVKCSKCKNEQIIFEKSASNVTCSVCKEILAKSTGGKSNVIAKVIKEL